MAANEKGDANHSSHEEMAAFDRLPKTLRAVLNNAGHNFNSVQMRDELRNGWRTCRELVADIKAFDAELTRQQSMEKFR